MNKVIPFVLILFLSDCSFAQTSSLTLDYELAEKLAALPLHCLETEYPNKLNQVLTDSSFLHDPSDLHPIFYGCFDWHSSVHGYWLLARMRNRFPDTPMALKIEALFDRQFTSENVQRELAYFEPKLEKSFERTYGWAWLLKLQQELLLSPVDGAKGWSSNLKSLVDFVVTAYKEFLPKLVYPIRAGEHNNTAFGLSLALDYCRTVGDREFETLIQSRSRDYFLDDVACPISWEPSGFDFISPCLMEAELMAKLLEKEEYEKWLKRFLPELFMKKFRLEPALVLDRTDGKLVHLDGLNFLRAYCLYSMSSALPKNYEAWRNLADEHVRASMNEVAGSDYMGSHWLATFLVYALEERDEIWVVEIENRN